MLIRTWFLDGLTIIDLHGRLRGHGDGSLPEAVLDVIGAGRRDIVLNLGGLTDVDAAGLGQVAQAFRLARAQGGDIRMAVADERIRELLIRTRLLAVVPTFSSEAGAIASFETVSSR
jgi:anti-anti-sigma factor